MQMNQAEKVMARRAIRNVLIGQAIKLALIITIARSLKRAAWREQARRNG